MNPNESAFEQLLKFHVEVELPVSKLTVQCRRVPFVLVTDVLSRAFSHIQSDLRMSFKDVAEAFAKIPQAPQDGGSDEESRGYQMVMALLPALSGLIVNAPGLLERYISDVLVGATPAVVKSLCAEDAMAILSTTFSLMDKALLAKQVNQVFFGVAESAKQLETLRAADPA